MRTRVDMFDPCLLMAPVAVDALTSFLTAGRTSAACKTALPTCTASGLILSPDAFASSFVCSTFSGEVFCFTLAAALLSLFARFA